ncbi:MAG: pentapeptide repeat-containing protein [Cyanobacteria bacterium SBLK]|nr:pentapeptide repeat-containing protein [Cyanobacteria bacterium SBLK]
MAIKEQLEVLRQGVEEWNQWMEKNQGVRADLSGADLSGADLKGINLKNAVLFNANLIRADFSNANLTNADLSRTQVLETNFEGATLTGACVFNWQINTETKLNNVKCDYLSGDTGFTTRRPVDRNFRPGEFAQIFKTVNETLDRYLQEGIPPS